MRDRLEQTALRKIPAWIRDNERLCKLALMDLHLDGKIYGHLAKEFDEEASGDSSYVSMKHRRPSVRMNLAKMTARNIARKLFAGRHAPSLICEKKPEIIEKIQQLLDQADLESQMIDLVMRGSIGSVCASFKIVEVDEGPTLVMNIHRAVECFPTFDPAKQLKQLMLAKPVSARWFLDYGYTHDSQGQNIEPKKKYWMVRVLDKEREIHYLPIRQVDWNPLTGDNTKYLKEIEEGVLEPVVHELKMVPAHWFLNLSGGEFPDGDCLFEAGLDNIVLYDYGMSQLDLGIKNSACPMTVIHGSPQGTTDDEGKPIARSPQRYLQFNTTQKIEDVVEEGGDAKFLETNGLGFAAGLDYYRQLKKDAAEQISSSRKDPDKVTTSMSGKGMGIVEEEFLDLVFELRTNYGNNGYLKLIKKICKAAIRIDHQLMTGIDEGLIDLLKLSWPDLHEQTPQEYQQNVQALDQAQDAGLIDQRAAFDQHRAKTDMHQTSSKLPKKKEKTQSKTTT